MKPGLITSRRGFLGLLGLGGAAIAVPRMFQRQARAAGAADGTNADDATEPVFLVFCTFDGGWDQLLAFDPRDNTRFTDPAKLHPAYDVAALSDPTLAQVLADTGGTGLVTPTGSNITFGPAVGKLANRFADLSVVRGVFMGTLTHEVGKRYFLTGKFPRGLQASGSSLATWAVAQSGDRTPIPNLVVGTESYNEGLDPFASGLVVNSSTDVLTVLSRIGTALPGTSTAAIDSYVWAQKCADTRLDGSGHVTAYLDSYERAKVFSEGTLAQHFNFKSTGASAEIQALYEAFSVTPNQGLSQTLAGPKGQAMIAAQAITQGVSQAVSIRLASNIDHHDDDWASLHSTALRNGFDALDALIGHLQAVELPGTGKSYWDRTIVVVGSDFARTPTLNSRGGRDHHLASTALIASGLPSLRGNTVIGGTDDATMAGLIVDPKTGATSEDGVSIRPADVHATVCHAAGLSYDHVLNQDPKLLEPLLA